MKFHSLTKMLTVGLIAVVTAALLAGCGSESSQKKFLNIATGGTAGTYYPIGGAMAEILNKEIPGMNASAQSTGATVANINMLKDNSVDLAIVQNDITYYAVNGTEMFKDKKVDNIRGIASLYPAPALRRMPARSSKRTASPTMTSTSSTCPSPKAPAPSRTATSMQLS